MENLIQVSPPTTTHEKRSLAIALFILLFIVGVISFILGFVIGKINYSAPAAKIAKESSLSAQVALWSLYQDKEASFAISHPKDWSAEKHNKAGYDGVKISSKKGYVDLTLLVDQPYSLGDKHQKALEKEEAAEASIADKKAAGTSYKYKAGNYFIVLVLPDSEFSPQVTFWVEADDDKTREEALKIVETFRFVN